MSLVDLLESPRELNGSIVGSQEAAGILGRSKSIIPKYVKSGLLKSFDDRPRKSNPFQVHKEEVELLRDAQNALETLNPYIKEMYMLHREGVSIDNLARQFEPELGPVSEETKTQIDIAIGLYKFQRNKLLREYGLSENEIEDALLQNEVMARLKITADGVVKEMCDKGLLSLVQTQKPSSIMPVSYTSFERYIESYRTLRTYDSRAVKELFSEAGFDRISLPTICNDAKANDKGRKIFPDKSKSHYFFSRQHAEELISIHRRKCRH